MGLDISVPSAGRVARWLLAVVLVLVGFHLAGQSAKYFLGHGNLKGFVPAFYLDAEPSVPTWYSSVALAAAGALLAIIAAAKVSRRDRYRWHWVGLAGLFFLLSMDEVAMFHEYPIEPLREWLHAGGLLYYTWVIPGAALVAMVGLLLVGFLRHLPTTTRWRFLLAGAVFVTGAIGVEMLSGLLADRHGEENFAYVLVITLEEFMEMLGVVILLHALLDYLAREVGEIRVRLSQGEAEARRRAA